MQTIQPIGQNSKTKDLYDKTISTPVKKQETALRLHLNSINQSVNLTGNSENSNVKDYQQ
jgi:hypothetical protein